MLAGEEPAPRPCYRKEEWGETRAVTTPFSPFRASSLSQPVPSVSLPGEPGKVKSSLVCKARWDDPALSCRPVASIIQGEDRHQRPPAKSLDRTAPLLSGFALTVIGGAGTTLFVPFPFRPTTVHSPCPSSSVAPSPTGAYSSLSTAGSQSMLSPCTHHEHPRDSQCQHRPRACMTSSRGGGLTAAAAAFTSGVGLGARLPRLVAMLAVLGSRQGREEGVQTPLDPMTDLGADAREQQSAVSPRSVSFTGVHKRLVQPSEGLRGP